MMIPAEAAETAEAVEAAEGEGDGCQWARRAMQGEGDWRGSVEKEGR